MLAKGFARIHRQNLINYGVLPLIFADPADYDRLDKGDILHVHDLRLTLEWGKDIALEWQWSDRDEAWPYNEADWRDPRGRSD